MPSVLSRQDVEGVEFKLGPDWLYDSMCTVGIMELY